jgi:hypothetical protein
MGAAPRHHGLPEFEVRRSARARRVRLTVTAREGLVVTLPPGVAETEALRAVERKRAWAAGALERVASRRALLLADPALTLPHEVDLPAFGGLLPVEYRAGSSKRATARADGPTLVVAGAVDDAIVCRDALRRWRDRTARERLPGLLGEISAATGIPYARVALRSQRTRWGSCSTRGTISLNRNLIFLPEELVRYVLAHELAHRVHADHSPRFHALLGSIEPRAGELRKALRHAHDLVPVWADA